MAHRNCKCYPDAGGQATSFDYKWNENKFVIPCVALKRRSYKKKNVFPYSCPCDNVIYVIPPSNSILIRLRYTSVSLDDVF